MTGREAEREGENAAAGSIDLPHVPLVPLRHGREARSTRMSTSSWKRAHLTTCQACCRQSCRVKPTQERNTEKNTNAPCPCGRSRNSQRSPPNTLIENSSCTSNSSAAGACRAGRPAACTSICIHIYIHRMHSYYLEAPGLPHVGRYTVCIQKFYFVWYIHPRSLDSSSWSFLLLSPSLT